MLKFAFWIRNSYGHKVDGITIMARNHEDAERKLRQMYRYCEVIRCDISVPRQSGQMTEDASAEALARSSK